MTGGHSASIGVTDISPADSVTCRLSEMNSHCKVAKNSNVVCISRTRY